MLANFCTLLANALSFSDAENSSSVACPIKQSIRHACARNGDLNGKIRIHSLPFFISSKFDFPSFLRLKVFESPPWLSRHLIRETSVDCCAFHNSYLSSWIADEELFFIFHPRISESQFDLLYRSDQFFCELIEQTYLLRLSSLQRGKKAVC